jgi:hypothetical protein
MAFPFQVIGLAKADDADFVGGNHQVADHVETLAKQSYREPTILAVVLSLVPTGMSCFEIEVRGTFERKAAELFTLSFLRGSKLTLMG